MNKNEDKELLNSNEKTVNKKKKLAIIICTAIITIIILFILIISLNSKKNNSDGNTNSIEESQESDTNKYSNGLIDYMKSYSLVDLVDGKSLKITFYDESRCGIYPQGFNHVVDHMTKGTDKFKVEYDNGHARCSYKVKDNLIFIYWNAIWELMYYYKYGPGLSGKSSLQSDYILKNAVYSYNKDSKTIEPYNGKWIVTDDGLNVLQFVAETILEEEEEKEQPEDMGTFYETENDEEIVTRKIKDIPVNVTNLNSDYLVKADNVESTNVSVMVKGKRKILKNITGNPEECNSSNCIRAEIDLTGYTIGVYDVPVVLKTEIPDIEISSTEDLIMVTVNIFRK